LTAGLLTLSVIAQRGGPAPPVQLNTLRMPPAVKLGPHVAALGLIFYTGDMFPAEYKNELLIAQHGSWNRSNPIGYRIGLVHVHEGQFASGQRIFAEGWLQGRQPWGRPVDLLQAPDGSLLVSDDLQGRIYRITYRAG